MKSRIIKIFFAAFIAIAAVSAQADTETVNGITWTYTVTDGKASIYSGSDWSPAIPESTSGAITIPSTLGGYPVMSIGDYAFNYCSSLTSVTIPDSVTSIGDYAFEDCYSLTSLTIPDSVTSIGDWAFYDCSSLKEVHISDVAKWCNIKFLDSYANPLLYAHNLYLNGNKVTQLVIPDSVTSIGYNAFRGCSSLTSVTIPDSVTSIGDEAFRGCSGLADSDGFVIVKGVLYDYFGEGGNVVIPNGVTSIGDFAFSGCRSLTSVTIGKSVTSIGGSAFYGCSSLTSLTIPDSVMSIGNSAFSRCESLYDKTTIPGLTLVDGWVIDCEASISGDLNLVGIRGIGDCAFRDCSSLTGVTIPDSVTSIGDSAFSVCSSLTSVTMGNSVTSIGNYAFYRCSSLTSVTIGDSVTSIGDYAFCRCGSLTSVTIPNSVINIGSGAFLSTWSLVNIYVEEDNKNYKSIDGLLFTKDEKTLIACPGERENIVIPNGVTSIGYGAFYECDSLMSVTIGDSVTSIGDNAFDYCRSLTSVTIGKSVTSIGDSAFSGCSLLTSVTIPDSVTSIGDFAFSGCRSLTSVTIPDSVTSIGDSAFGGCSSLTSVTIGDSVTSIGDSAFAYCYSLTSVTIPNSVTNIGSGAFLSTRSLVNIYVEEDNKNYKSIDGLLFTKEEKTLIACPGERENIVIPNGVTSIGDGAFYECHSLKNVTIPDSVTSIGDGAFYSCSSLTSVTIPDSVTSIGNFAFEYCESLTSVTIGDSVMSIGNFAFEYCESLTSVTIGDSVTSIGDHAFYCCSSLTSVMIPDSVTSIGYGAFYDCYLLTSVIISESLRDVVEGNDVFWGCSEDLEIIYRGEIKNVVAKQRYPWNGKVDITYNVTGNIGAGLPEWMTQPVLVVSALDRTTGSNYVSHVSALSGDTGIEEGEHHVVWDLNVQGLQIKSDDVVFTVMYAPALQFSGTAWYVNASRGSDSNSGNTETSAMATIQAAVNASSAGDTILVAPGTYSRFSTNNKAIHIYGIDGADATVIDGGGNYKKTNQLLLSQEGGSGPMTNTVVEGFTIQRLANIVSGTIKRCIIKNNNSSSGGAGGGACAGSVVENCLIIDNVGMNGAAADGCLLKNCTMVGNRATDSYNGVCLNSVLENCIIYGNANNERQTWSQWFAGWIAEIGYREKNVYVGDPKFVDAANGDYRLASGSPCIDAGDNLYVDSNRDLDGNQRISNGKVDIGCFEFGQSLLADNIICSGSSKVDIGCFEFGQSLLADNIICSGSSEAIKIDSHMEPAVNSIEVSYNSAWVGGDSSAEVVISDNGMEIKRTTGEGEFVWSPETASKHTLTYTTYIDGVAQEEVYTATVFKDWKYTVDNGGATIVETTQTSGDVVIPSEIDGLPVVGLAEGLFNGCEGITSVTIPDSVTDIGSGFLYDLTQNAWEILNNESDNDSIVYKSNDINHNGSTYMTMIIEGPLELSFDWKVSSESGFDYLRWYLDGTEKSEISGTGSGWQTITYSLPAGEHTIKWEYSKDGSVDKGEDCSWVRLPRPKATLFDGCTNLEYVILPERFGGLVDYEGVTVIYNDYGFSLGGDANWVNDALDAPNSSNGSLRSGKIGINETSWMEMTTPGPGRLTYRWKASSEYYEDQSLGVYRIYDYGYLAIDDDPKGFLDENYMTNGIAIGGHTSWQDVELDISGEGAHKIKWVFAKDEYDDPETIGEDCIWVDDIKFRPLVTLSFNLGGGVGDAPVALTGLFESFVTLPSSDGFEREDHIFEGWYDGENLYESGEKYEVPKTNVVLTAQWIAKRFHTFNLNGGAGQVPAVIKDIPGTIITLPDSSAFDRDYYTFVGWSDGVRTYSANATYTVGDEGVEFIAVWNPNTISAPVIVSSSVSNGGILDAPSATITMSCENGADIYYTLDGSTPTAESTKYTGTFETFGLGNVTIKAIALRDNYFDSEITTFTYTRKAYTLAESINASGMNVTSTGASPWFRVLGDESCDGSEAIRSGAIGAGETSTVEMTVEGNGAISFWWKVSSHEDPRGGKFDHVAFFVDDVEVAWISGEKDWANITYTVIGVGSHTLKWVYKKNGDAYTSGMDCAWLDEVVFEKILVAIDEPVAVEGLVYNGLEQMGVIEADGYTLSGVTAATDAGEYTATATLADGYKWADGSMDDKTITWSIAKATNEWVVEPKISLESWTEGDVAGELTGGVAKFGEVIATINGATFTALPTEPGSYTIEFTVAETTSYTGLDKSNGLNRLVTFEILEMPNPVPAINSDWGYVVTKLGEKKDEVAVVFTNHTEKAMTWTVPVNLENVQFLVVGGGGGGGSAGTGGGGGAGGGGVVTGMIHKLELDSTISVVVGAGGAEGTRNSAGGLLASAQGGNSTLTIGSVGAITAYGGAKVHKDGEYSGGSGNGSYGAGKAGTATKGKVDLSVEELVYSVESFGNNGGYGYNNKIGGGGGGAYPGDEGRGGSATSSVAGKGGAGLVSNITGEPITYGSGGGGSMSTVGASGGEGGGNGCSGKSAKANQGGGGGGAGKYSSGGKGGSGIVVIRYTIPSYLLPDTSKVFPEITDDSKVASVLEGLSDTKVIENITDAATYTAFREWVLGLEGVLSYEVKESSNLWLSYVLNTDKLIEGEVTESRLKVTSFKLSGENNLFSIKLKLDGVDVGDAATVENLLKIFAIEGAKELSDDSFSVDNVTLEVVEINEGEVEFIVTPRVKGNPYFFRARMRDNVNSVGMNSFTDERDKVQLWEGGPYWATTNIGAENPEDYGYYFWWGDTVGYKWENEKWVASDGSNSNFSFGSDNTPTFGKDNLTLQSEGWITANGVLAPEHDAAQAHWGGDWRMPTNQELEDLNDNCDWTWTTMNGINGYIVRGRGEYASNSIFLPCAGYGYGTSLYNAGSLGYYWSSDPFSDTDSAWYLYFYSGYHCTSSRYRYDGQSVRPLQGFTK